MYYAQVTKQAKNPAELVRVVLFHPEILRLYCMPLDTRTSRLYVMIPTVEKGRRLSRLAEIGIENK